MKLMHTRRSGSSTSTLFSRTHFTSEPGQILSFIFVVVFFLQTIWKSLFAPIWRKMCHCQQHVSQHYYLLDILVRIEEEYLERGANSRIHHFLPECIALLYQIYQNALRYDEKTRTWSRRLFSRGPSEND